MTTELEQEFFKVFGIEPVPIKSYGYWLIKGSIAENDKGEKVVYPEITAEKLLELICVHNTYLETKLYSLEVKDLKDEILQDLIDEQELREIKKDYVNDDLKQQVRSLFEVKNE